MVRLVVLDEDVDPPDEATATATATAITSPSKPYGAWNDDEVEAMNDERPNPNLNQFSAALSCYPIVSQLASCLDLNALHELSRTCRQVRANLLQYRMQLVTQTLRCENEKADPARRLGHALQASHAVWTAYGRDGVKVGRITSGKVGACARDMVGECRRCARVVCRNCVIKAPPTSTLKGRHRRLCRTCMKSSLDQLTTVSVADADALDLLDSAPSPGFTPRLVARDPCTCASAGVWLCQPCGAATRTADTTYLRGWTWRTRYSVCGGIGAGLGEGNEGVECGRTRDCRDARLVEKDVECDAAELAALDRRWEGSSYATQEVVGIGGKVKKKVRKRVPVGAIVKEYEDERVTEVFLGREQNGLNRSWCSWCERVVLGKKDMDAIKSSRGSVGSTASVASST